MAHNRHDGRDHEDLVVKSPPLGMSTGLLPPRYAGMTLSGKPPLSRMGRGSAAECTSIFWRVRSATKCFATFQVTSNCVFVWEGGGREEDGAGRGGESVSGKTYRVRYTNCGQ